MVGLAFTGVWFSSGWRRLPLALLAQVRPIFRELRSLTASKISTYQPVFFHTNPSAPNILLGALIEIAFLFLVTFSS